MKKRAKKWWRSRTIWLNVIAGGVAFAAGSWDQFAQANLPQWAWYSGGVVLAMANIGLRLVTTTSIEPSEPR